jgi:hypothetical protein
MGFELWALRLADRHSIIWAPRQPSTNLLRYVKAFLIISCCQAEGILNNSHTFFSQSVQCLWCELDVGVNLGFTTN